jgi:hypothetical protein
VRVIVISFTLAPLAGQVVSCPEHRSPLFFFGGFFFFPPFSCTTAWATLSPDSTSSFRIRFTSRFPLQHSLSPVALRDGATHPQQSTQGHWACRTHLEPGYPGSFELDQNI